MGGAQANWELRREAGRGDRPPVVEGVTTVRVGDEGAAFPRYLNEIGVNTIRIHFSGAGSAEKKLTFIWTGGSLGPDCFRAHLDGAALGMSPAVETPRYPDRWYRTELPCTLGSGTEHVLELSSADGFDSAIEFGAIALTGREADPYQPLCYESVGSLAGYERVLGAKGSVAARPHLSVFAPLASREQAQGLADALEEAYRELRTLTGADTIFRFSVEHYPVGHPRGWGGLSGRATISYTTESLSRFGRLGTSDVRGFVGYVEEMSHGFCNSLGCGGTYEALGIALSEEVSRRLTSKDAADKYWMPEHLRWRETQKAYLAAGRNNPDPEQYPWNVLYTRILNALLLSIREEQGAVFWPSFFAVLREMDYPVFRAKRTEVLRTYADVFSKVLERDMRAEFAAFGIDLSADPPWGWRTHQE